MGGWGGGGSQWNKQGNWGGGGNPPPSIRTLDQSLLDIDVPTLHRDVVNRPNYSLSCRVSIHKLDLHRISLERPHPLDPGQPLPPPPASHSPEKQAGAGSDRSCR